MSERHEDAAADDQTWSTKTERYYEEWGRDLKLHEYVVV